MATILRTPKGDVRFNSYYLAVVEKNKLLKKGLKAEIIDYPHHSRLPQTRDNQLRTIYSPQEQKMLAKLRRDMSPQMFGAEYRASKRKKGVSDENQA